MTPDPDHYQQERPAVVMEPSMRKAMRSGRRGVRGGRNLNAAARAPAGYRPFRGVPQEKKRRAIGNTPYLVSPTQERPWDRRRRNRARNKASRRSRKKNRNG